MNKNDVIRYFENQGWGEWTAEEFEAFYNNDRNTCYFMERCAELRLLMFLSSCTRI